MMRMISICLLLLPVMALAQPEFRSIIDSSVICAYQEGSAVTRYFDPAAPAQVREEVELDVFYIVEQMPSPEIQPAKLEHTLSNNVRLNQRERTISGTIYFQCVVNCEGKAGDFQIIQCTEGMANICFQVFDVVRKVLLEWKPGKQRDRSVDVLIMIKCVLNEGDFEVVVPLV